MGGEVKGKLANGVGSQYSTHYLGTWCIQHADAQPRLPVVDCIDDPADLNGLARFAEKRNLVSAHVPSHFKRSLHQHSELIHSAQRVHLPAGVLYGCGHEHCCTFPYRGAYKSLARPGRK